MWTSHVIHWVHMTRASQTMLARYTRMRQAYTYTSTNMYLYIHQRISYTYMYLYTSYTTQYTNATGIHIHIYKYVFVYTSKNFIYIYVFTYILHHAIHECDTQYINPPRNIYFCIHKRNSCTYMYLNTSDATPHTNATRNWYIHLQIIFVYT